LSLAASVRYDGRSITWIAGKLMGRGANYAFNTYIWFALLLVIAAFIYVVAALFSAIPGAATAAVFLTLSAVIVGLLMYRTRLGLKGGTLIGLALIALAIYLGYHWGIKLSFYEWVIILTVYCVIAASLPVWVLLQPRDYLNVFILWAALAIGGAAAIVAGFKGYTMTYPALTSFMANVVHGVSSPFWPAVILVVACGALSGFHSLVGSGTSSKQLASELDALLVGYGGMLTEGFLATLVVVSLGGFLGYALLSPALTDLALKKATGIIASALNIPASSVDVKSYESFVHKLLTDPNFAAQWWSTFLSSVGKLAPIPYSYSYLTHAAFGLDIKAMAIFAALWITGFALTSLDTAARLGRFAWQELFMWLRERSERAYRLIANRWIASLIIVILGALLAWSKAFTVIWPAFSGMNQLLASLALMTISIWVIKVQRATLSGRLATLIPAVFLWITVTVALIWFLVAVVPTYMMKKPLVAITVATAVGVGLGLNLYLFTLWLSALRAGTRPT